MNITVTGRHITVSDNQKSYAEKKIRKLETYFQQLIDAHVVMHVEKLDCHTEVIVNGDGVQFHGREKAADFYSAIDLLFEKMEKQVVRYKERHTSHKGPRNGESLLMGFEDDKGQEIRLNQVSNKPIDRIEAYLQMKTNEEDFILFKQGISDMESSVDYSNKRYATLYKNGGGMKLVEIPFESIKDNHFENKDFIEYDVEVLDDSSAHPEIKFNKKSSCSVKGMTIVEAMDELGKNGHEFLPFFNVESQYLNVVYKNGKECEVMVPTF